MAPPVLDTYTVAGALTFAVLAFVWTVSQFGVVQLDSTTPVSSRTQ